jgi:uncharacterized protein involved in cysteine biosynthesis
MEYILRGAKMVFTDRRLRRYLTKPLLWTILIYFVISFSASTLAARPITALLDRLQFIPEGWTPWIARIVFFIAWSFIGGPIFFGLNGTLSSILWDELSLHAEEDAFGSAPRGKTTFTVALSDTLRRLPLTLAVAVLSFFLGIFGIGWASIWPVGWLSLYDFTAAAYARRGVYYPQQKHAAKRSKKGFMFAMGCGLVSLFPLINLILLPGCIVGATLLVRDEEERAKSLSNGAPLKLPS